ncbi:MAG TPA: lysylphosphatidylglycerol synthase transmembrane domain-containing protein [Anaerolineales bacterium]|nr:lysylphosphatidylglycerol synthase transmembrane domain-containing protein [Anaerolineales bacterium]
MSKLFRSPGFWIGLVITLASLAYVWQTLQGEALNTFWARIGSGNYGWLLAAFLMQWLSVIARSQRWAVLLGLRGKLWTAFWAQGIGFLFTNILPLRLGEAARVLVMSERAKLPLVQVAVTAVIERVLDVATTVLLLLFVLPFMDVPPLVAQSGLTLGTVVLIGLISLPFVVRFEKKIADLLRALGARVRWLPMDALLRRWDEFVVGLQPLTRPASALAVFGWGAVSWFFSVMMFACGLWVFQPTGTVFEATFMIVTLAFAITVPSSPGFLGVYQAAGQFALATAFAAKYDEPLALACTMACWVGYYVPTTLLGVVGMTQVGASFGELGRRILPK